MSTLALSRHALALHPRALTRYHALSALLVLALLAVLPGGPAFPSRLQSDPLQASVLLDSAVLKPVTVNGQHGLLFWLHGDGRGQESLQPIVDIPTIPAREIQDGFVAIQGHGEVFRGQHYLLMEGVHQWVRTEDFVAAVRSWLGTEAQVLLLACNPDGIPLDIPNTIYWRDNIVDVTYGYGPWLQGKYIEDDPANGHQAPVNTAAAQTALGEAIDRLHAAIGAQSTAEAADTP